MQELYQDGKGSLPFHRSLREAFLEGGEAGLTFRAADVVDEERKTLKSGMANPVVDNELLRERIRQMEEEKPFLRWRS